MNQIQLLVDYAMSFVGREYIYGGAGPYFDCSGFVIELMKSCGNSPPHDMTAQQLFEHYKPTSEWGLKAAGSIAFYGRATNAITHVAWCVNPYQMIEAGGGTSETVSLELARRKNAFIRMRLIQDPSGLNGRRDFVAVLYPKYPRIGI